MSSQKNSNSKTRSGSKKQKSKLANEEYRQLETLAASGNVMGNSPYNRDSQIINKVIHHTTKHCIRILSNHLNDFPTFANNIMQQIYTHSQCASYNEQFPMSSYYNYSTINDNNNNNNNPHNMILSSNQMVQQCNNKRGEQLIHNNNNDCNLTKSNTNKKYSSQSTSMVSPLHSSSTNQMFAIHRSKRCDMILALSGISKELDGNSIQNKNGVYRVHVENLPTLLHKFNVDNDFIKINGNVEQNNSLQLPNNETFCGITETSNALNNYPKILTEQNDDSSKIQGHVNYTTSSSETTALLDGNCSSVNVGQNYDCSRLIQQQQQQQQEKQGQTQEESLQTFQVCHVKNKKINNETEGANISKNMNNINFKNNYINKNNEWKEESVVSSTNTTTEPEKVFQLSSHIMDRYSSNILNDQTMESMANRNSNVAENNHIHFPALQKQSMENNNSSVGNERTNNTGEMEIPQRNNSNNNNVKQFQANEYNQPSQMSICMQTHAQSIGDKNHHSLANNEIENGMRGEKSALHLKKISLITVERAVNNKIEFLDILYSDGNDVYIRNTMYFKSFLSYYFRKKPKTIVVYLPCFKTNQFVETHLCAAPIYLYKLLNFDGIRGDISVNTLAYTQQLCKHKILSATTKESEITEDMSSSSSSINFRINAYHSYVNNVYNDILSSLHCNSYSLQNNNVEITSQIVNTIVIQCVSKVLYCAARNNLIGDVIKNTIGYQYLQNLLQLYCLNNSITNNSNTVDINLVICQGALDIIEKIIRQTQKNKVRKRKSYSDEKEELPISNNSSLGSTGLYHSHINSYNNLGTIHEPVTILNEYLLQ